MRLLRGAKSLLAPMCLALLGSNLAVPANADGFTGAVFLEWETSQQRGYIDAQLVMASTIATRIKPDLSQCLADEFYGPSGLTNDGFELMTDRIREFSEYHPSSVLVVVIENVCGGFD